MCIEKPGGGSLEAVGHWPCTVGTKNKTKAIDRNLSSTLIGPHQGHGGGEREEKKRRPRRARPRKDEAAKVQK